jgi:hypothetical protein
MSYRPVLIPSRRLHPSLVSEPASLQPERRAINSFAIRVGDQEIRAAPGQFPMECRLDPTE